ncbi:uncharacterized protein LOC127353785 [Dicentrarchus labrax]|uniref:uncharacterized protein LOC127353785 n=1 Tax=Dicentrarchus labrax TaxID=13489 RepID=UPI0021F68B33|nr:uncharacterized protein LOC127353785 [Dicentrarchus labrax]
MRVLLVSCLLIRSVTCGPAWKGSSSDDPSFRQRPLSPGYWFSGTGVSSDPGSSSSLPSLPNPNSVKAAQDATNMAPSFGGYANVWDGGYSNPKAGNYEVAYAAQPSGYYGSAPVGDYASAYVGDSSYGFSVSPQDESQSSGSATGTEFGDTNPEPVFSDVSDLEPLYSFSSRSRYQRGRAMLAQSRYTPGEAVLPMAAARRSSKTPSKQSSPAKAPPKGGF